MGSYKSQSGIIALHNADNLLRLWAMWKRFRQKEQHLDNDDDYSLSVA